MVQAIDGAALLAQHFFHGVEPGHTLSTLGDKRLAGELLLPAFKEADEALLGRSQLAQDVSAGARSRRGHADQPPAMANAARPATCGARSRIAWAILDGVQPLPVRRLTSWPPRYIRNVGNPSTRSSTHNRRFSAELSLKC